MANRLTSSQYDTELLSAISNLAHGIENLSNKDVQGALIRSKDAIVALEYIKDAIVD